MFGRNRKTTHTGPLLLAAVVARLGGLRGPIAPVALVQQLRLFLESVDRVVERTGGNVLQFVGNFSLSVWVCGPGAERRDPISIGRQLLRDVRARLDSQKSPALPPLTLCVGLATGDCVYERQKGHVVRVVGHAWFRLRDFPAKLGGDGDAILLDRSLKDVLASDAQHNLGDGWYRVPGA